MMIGQNLKALRTRMQLTQEQVAEAVNVSRQVIAKWERGESTPDISYCVKLAKLFDVSLDNLVSFEHEGTGVMIPPKGKHFFGSVKLGERGQIVIPKQARELFQMKPGDNLVIVGDEDRGLAIVPESYMKVFFTFLQSQNAPNEE